MARSRPVTIAVVAILVLASVAGVGLAADMPHATDGKIANGEELKAPQDKDDQVFPINYTFSLQNHQPGNTDGAVQHFAVGLTENGTLHRIKLYSEDFGFGNCEPDNTAAFGIDRNNDDPGTNTDKSLLTAFKSYNSQANYIDIKFYKESTIAGEPVRGDVNDQIVAAQNSCYDNPSEPGWYRINGTITGNVAGGTNTDYKIRDLSQWVYVCDCSSRQEAEQKLGPPPGQGGGGDSGGDGGSGGDASTPTATATATAASGGDGGDSGSDGGDATPTATATAASGGGGGGDSGSGGGGGGGGATPTATATGSGGGNGQDSGGATPTATTTGTNGGGSDGGSGGATTGTATVTGADGGSEQNGGTETTPTAGDGPGFGAVAALLGLLAAALLATRRY